MRAPAIALPIRWTIAGRRSAPCWTTPATVQRKSDVERYKEISDGSTQEEDEPLSPRPPPRARGVGQDEPCPLPDLPRPDAPARNLPDLWQLPGRQVPASRRQQRQEVNSPVPTSGVQRSKEEARGDDASGFLCVLDAHVQHIHLALVSRRCAFRKYTAELLPQAGPPTVRCLLVSNIGRWSQFQGSQTNQNWKVPVPELRTFNK